MQFLTSHPTRWLRTRRFSKPTFRPSGATEHWENTVLRNFSTFSRALIFLLVPFSSRIFFLLPFSSLTLTTSVLSCVHIVGSLTAKFPTSILMSQRKGLDASYLLFAVNILVHTLWTDQSVFRRLEGVLAVRTDQHGQDSDITRPAN